MRRFDHAIVRPPAASFAAGLTTVAWSSPPSHARVCEQHRAYVEALRGAGLRVEVLEPLDDLPDAHFVEDVALVVPELAILTRPGAEARRGEVAHVREALARHRPLATIEAPATLDGGDVLIAGREVFVGRSARTNAAGVEALAAALVPHGYRVIPIPVADGLHFKSSVNLIAAGVLVATPSFAARPELGGFEIVEVPEAEAAGANVLWVNDRLLVPAGYPALTAELRARGHELELLDMSEVEKMDGGLSCLSLRF